MHKWTYFRTTFNTKGQTKFYKTQWFKLHLNSNQELRVKKEKKILLMILCKYSKVNSASCRDWHWW